jgi:predicted dienelactone hydrolase
MENGAMEITRRTLIAASLCAGLPVRAAPPAPQDGDWLDAARQRKLPWRLRLPAGEGPCPLVVYSHGLGGSRDGGARWGRAWAEAGIAVLHLQHAGSDFETLRGGLSALRAAGNAQQLLARVADVRFALDELARRAGTNPWGRLRADALGMAGHSFGAHTTQALAGQRYRVPGSLADERFRAFIALSPSAPPGMPVQQAFGAIQRPFLLATGSLDGDPFGSYAGGEPRAAVYDGLPPGQRALLWLDGADHTTFGGGAPEALAGRVGRARPAAALEREAAHEAIVARTTTLWWRAQLLDEAAARAALARPEGLTEGDRWSLG